MTRKTDKTKISEEDLERLTESVKQGKLIDEAEKNLPSSSSSVRGKILGDWRPIFSWKELIIAYSSVKKGSKKKPTSLPDYREVDDLDDSELTLLGKFHKNHQWNIAKLYLSLNLLRNYRISPYIAFTVPKGKKSERRTIFSPLPKDRIVFTAVLNKVKDNFIFLTNFNILGLGLLGNGALDNPEKYFQSIITSAKENVYFLKTDISNFFPSINRLKLMTKLNGLKLDQKMTRIIDLSINAPLNIYKKQDKSYFKNYEVEGKGIPQGCAYSPLLANFYFSHIDKILSENNEIDCYRYLDDIIIFSKQRKCLEWAMQVIKKEAGGLNLSVKDSKTSDGRIENGFEFLGVLIVGSEIFIPRKAVDKLIAHIKNHVSNPLDTQQELKLRNHLADVIQGWGNFYSKAAKKDYFDKITSINSDIIDAFSNLPNGYISKFLYDKRLYLGGRLSDSISKR